MRVTSSSSSFELIEMEKGCSGFTSSGAGHPSGMWRRTKPTALGYSLSQRLKKFGDSLRFNSFVRSPLHSYKKDYGDTDDGCQNHLGSSSHSVFARRFARRLRLGCHRGVLRFRSHLSGNLRFHRRFRLPPVLVSCKGTDPKQPERNTTLTS